MFYYPTPYFSVYQYPNLSIVSILLSIYYYQLYFISLPISIPAIQLDSKLCTLSFTYTLLISLSVVLSYTTILYCYILYYYPTVYYLHQSNCISILHSYTISIYTNYLLAAIQLYSNPTAIYSISYTTVLYILYPILLPPISTYHTFI